LELLNAETCVFECVEVCCLAMIKKNVKLNAETTNQLLNVE
jgi:hypothetical protein